MELFATVSRFLVGPSGVPYPVHGEAAPDDHPATLQWKAAADKIAEVVTKESSTFYHVRYQDEVGNVSTITCYTSKESYLKMKEAAADIFKEVSEARRAMADHLGLTIEVKEVALNFEDVSAIANYSELNKLFESLPDDRIHSSVAVTPGA